MRGIIFAGDGPIDQHSKSDFLAAGLHAIHLETTGLGQAGAEPKLIPPIRVNPFRCGFFKVAEHDLAREKLFA